MLNYLNFEFYIKYESVAGVGDYNKAVELDSNSVGCLRESRTNDTLGGNKG